MEDQCKQAAMITHDVRLHQSKQTSQASSYGIFAMFLQECKRWQIPLPAYKVADNIIMANYDLIAFFFLFIVSTVNVASKSRFYTWSIFKILGEKFPD